MGSLFDRVNSLSFYSQTVVYESEFVSDPFKKGLRINLVQYSQKNKDYAAYCVANWKAVITNGGHLLHWSSGWWSCG